MFPILDFELVHWDYWQRVQLPLSAPIVTIVGPNGSGKTTLLDGLRTLLGQDCSKKREYKRYARRSGQAYSWLRAVVDNRRTGARPQPFFPLRSERVTLACRIEKKGGDWTREYSVTENDASIEQLAASAQWQGLREYQRRLEHAGLSHAIARVLSLEQGQTDKLCEYSPRSLLELVFHVFGDKTVLDRYSEARDHQRQMADELRDFDARLQNLGAEVERLNGEVNRYQEWKRLTDERMQLTSEILPRLQHHELREAIRQGRAPLLSRRRDHAEARAELFRLTAALPQLQAAADEAELRHTDWNQVRAQLQSKKEAAQEQQTRAATILESRERLLKAATAAGGADAAQLTQQLEAQQRREDEARRHCSALSQRLNELDDVIARLLRGERHEPAEVERMRAQLTNAGVAHWLLVEMVEIQDERWQTAVEALLAPYRHLIMLERSDDQALAFAIGEKLRYRHFIVPDNVAPILPIAGSLLEVVRFTKAAPLWLMQLLERTQRVADAAAGSRLARGQDWITQDGYLRERRGGRFAASAERHFGRARLTTLQEERVLVARQVAECAAEQQAAQQQIGVLKTALEGIHAPRELAVRSEEFAAAESESAAALTQIEAIKGQQIDADEQIKRVDKERIAAHISLQQAQEQKKPLEEKILRTANREARAEQIRRVQQLRRDNATLPPAWRDRAANQQLAEQWDSAKSVARVIERIEKTLAEGEWVTDEKIIVLRDLRREDYQRQSDELAKRKSENQRAMEHTDAARGAYIEVLRHTLRAYGQNLKALGALAHVGVELNPPRLDNDDATLIQAGLDVRFNFDQKGFAGMNDGEASGGQQVIKSLILLIGLMMDAADTERSGGFVFIDEPFAHLDIMNIDRVAGFLKATRAQYLITTPITHNINVYDPALLTLVTYKKKPGETWAPRIARLVRQG